MAKIIKESKETVLMEISRTELYIYIQAQVNMVDEMEIENETQQGQALLLLSAIEPLLKFALPETVKIYNSIKEEIVSLEWEENEGEEGEGEVFEDEQFEGQEELSFDEQIDDEQSDHYITE